jgi:hypothetical protein
VRRQHRHDSPNNSLDRPPESPRAEVASQPVETTNGNPPGDSDLGFRLLLQPQVIDCTDSSTWPHSYPQTLQTPLQQSPTENGGRVSSQQDNIDTTGNFVVQPDLSGFNLASYPFVYETGGFHGSSVGFEENTGISLLVEENISNSQVINGAPVYQNGPSAAICTSLNKPFPPLLQSTAATSGGNVSEVPPVGLIDGMMMGFPLPTAGNWEAICDGATSLSHPGEYLRSVDRSTALVPIRIS